MNSETPKQYIELHGKTVLEHTLSRFFSLPNVAGILVVVSEADTYWDRLVGHLRKQCEANGVALLSTFGGKERSGTVAKGLNYLTQKQRIDPNQWVMVHDAARPCVRQKDLLRLFEENSKVNCAGAILASPVRDTLKLSDKMNSVVTTQSRELLWQAQTPQLFQLGVLQDCLNQAQKAGVKITDEASAIEYCLKKVYLVEGSSDNIKLTTSSDLAIIEFLLNDTGG